MLNTLRRIVQEVSAARNLDQALALIVQRVKQALAVDVCSVYLADRAADQLVLMATDGLNPEAVGKVRLNMHEGLVSLVAEREEPVHIANAHRHPRFRYFPETGEARYRTFLGVPVIHHRKMLGVLVVQQHAAIRFGEELVAFLVTIAAQLAGAIAHAEASGGIDGLQRGALGAPLPLQGVPGSPGVAIGTAFVVHPQADIDTIPDRSVEDAEAEKERFLEAVRAVRSDVWQMVEQMRNVLPSGDNALFEAYLLMLDSESLIGGALKRINAGKWAPAALRDSIQENSRTFEMMDDSYLKERAEDVRDLGRRILQRMQQGSSDKARYPKRTLIVGEEITASILAEVPRSRIVGVVSARGSRTSHMAILARALGIPAVVGVDGLPVERLEGREIIADGYSGRVYVNPPAQVRREYVRLRRGEAEFSKGLEGLRDLVAETPDGVRIPLYANTGLLSDIGPSLSSGAEGIGLYRTEFPFMIRDRFPTEDEQHQVYRQVLESFSPRPVTMRTLDVGGDKALPYFPIKEDNPFLGWRGIRITLDHREIFLAQLRAMLRASAGLDNLNLLLPMISTVREADEALSLITRAVEELREEGVAVSRPQVGVMVEVPSAVYQAGHLARRADFLSVGTNDLTQYLLAVDRNNAAVADYYDNLHPAVIQAVRQVVKGARRHGKPVSVCGEMAGDPAAAILLLAMGIDSLSMSAPNLSRVKWVIRTISRKRAKELLGEVLDLEEADAIRSRLNAALEENGLGGLVHAGK